MSTKEELQDEVDSLKEDVGYWNGLFHDEEAEVMRGRAKLEEVEGQRDDYENQLWTANFGMDRLKEELNEAETLEEFQEIVNTLYRF